MKINGKENVREIVISHKGKNVKFACFINQSPYAPRLDLQETHKTEIIFDDTTEILSLIEIMEKFLLMLNDQPFW